ncbi:response regulator [Magnetospirillum sp. UT-4]|uniref:response regulator n=1 Tax=Magnetospirillum sp. UT-4 TaxID=2681467 RepID=UPI00137D508A|nr:response regulator [Magnetospirillum sp. UT-4]CAA7626476.1 Response regulator rcp1 [Magnetospirillum sp. UT-4]
MSIQKSKFDVLLVEDDAGDAGLVKIALRHGDYNVEVHHAKDCDEALAFLQRSGPEYASAPRPDLVFLDLNLPGRSGYEVLQEMKSSPALMRIPVVVLTTSEAERDVAHCYSMRANSFVSKPFGADEFNHAIHSIERYWFSVAQLPH